MRALKVSGIVVGAIVLLLLALVGILYLTRGTPVATVRTFGGAPPAVGDPLFRRTVELLAGMSLEQGNAIDVLVSGDQTYPPLWEDLRSAKKSITVQFYYSMPGQVATQLKDILIERARAGVEVLFLRDAFGSQRLTDEYQDSLVQAGVRVALFRPPRWYQLDKAAHRSHIRVVVVDGHVGYTGGFGLDDKFLGNGRVEGSWRDTNVRFLGPAVMQLQATFAAGWAEATGELLTGDVFFPLEEFKPDGDFYAALRA
jgi:cardiolipin synthase